MHRKSAPRVKRGLVQKKNNWQPSPSYRDGSRALPTLDRRRPGEGFRHLLKRADVEAFISLLPDWDDLAVGLDAIVLAPGGGAMGLHEPGIVHICAWESDLWWPDAYPEFVAEHREIFDLLGVDVARHGKATVVKWKEGQARAFQLLHVFLHELGHHHDRMTTRSKRETARGESYAETYANRYFASIWEGYSRVFGSELL